MNIHRTLIMVLAISGILGVSAMAEINYSRLYLVGDATPGEWNENLPEEMISIGNGCFLWDGWLKEGELKFLNTRGDWGSSIVTSSQGLEFDSGVSYDLFYQNGTDYKFYNKTPGVVRIVVDLRNMKVNFRRPVLTFTGDAAFGWSLENTIPVFADDEGNVSWNGQLRRGQLKILVDGGSNWAPCYNAPVEDDMLYDGGHAMIYHTSETDNGGNFVDFKYYVPKSGYYTLTFSRGEDGLFYGVTSSSASEPDLIGGFGSKAGRYLAAVDREAKRIHFGPVPARLYIGTSGSDCIELSSTSKDYFSSEVNLKKDSYYKLSSDPSNWESTAISPNVDTDITVSATNNVAPIHGYSYIVPKDGQYLVTADFTGNIPTLYAQEQIASSIASADIPNVQVTTESGVITVDGNYSSVAVYDVTGRLVGTTSPCHVPAGVYIVKVDNNIFKISVR